MSTIFYMNKQNKTNSDISIQSMFSKRNMRFTFLLIHHARVQTVPNVQTHYDENITQEKINIKINNF